MDSGDVVGLIAIVSLFIFLPWIILHYVTKWKTAATLTSGDEALLDELYRLARRLDERMTTVERLVSADHPEFQPLGRNAQGAGDDLGALDHMVARKGERA